MLNFNWKQYIENYPDLQSAGIKNEKMSIKHFNLHGKNEGRTYNKIGKQFPFKNNYSSSKMSIITPCCRPENIEKIIPFMDFNYINEWIIIYDGIKVSNFNNLNNPKIKQYIYTDINGKYGNMQRNYGLSKIEYNDFLYFLDDDNIIHPDIYKLLDNIEINKYYTFNNVFKNNIIRLPGNIIKERFIDTAMYLVNLSLENIKNIKWINEDIADGKYISDIYKLYPDKWVYVNNLKSYYNYLN